MKRICTVILLACFFLLAFGCSKEHTDMPAPVRPFNLYYRCNDAEYGNSEGLISSKQIDLGTEPGDISSILAAYLSCPVPDGMTSPFPAGTTLLSSSFSGSSVNVCLGGGYSELNGIGATIADSCIAKTLFQISGVDKVKIVVSAEDGSVLRSRMLNPESVILFDDSSDASSFSFLLYFPQQEGSLLIPERRSVPNTAGENELTIITESLLSGTSKSGLKSCIPEGTTLLDVSVEDGICSVDFSSDFLKNKPESAREERLAVMSVVNTLTELEGISEVRIYVEGKIPERYYGLSFENGFIQDSYSIGPVHANMYETLACVYLPLYDYSLLYPIPVKFKYDSSERKEEALLELLFDYQPGNGVSNPFADVRKPEVIVNEHGCACLDISHCSDDNSFPYSETQVKAIVLSLCSFEGIDCACFFNYGSPVCVHGLSNMYSGNIYPDDSWFCK